MQEMTASILQGILLPFIGTSLGAACVFLMSGTLCPSLRQALTGFAAGVMTVRSDGPIRLYSGSHRLLDRNPVPAASG